MASSNPLLLEDTSIKKQRKSNFSPEEIDVLVSNVLHYYDILYGQHSKKFANKDMRQQVWLNVLNQVNQVSLENRTLVEVKNKWKKCQHIYKAPEIIDVNEDDLDSMPLQQRITKHSTSSESQEPVLQSQPLSPTKLKVTRQQAKTPATPKAPTPEPPNEEVCLRWNSHHANMQTAFPSLLLKEQYVDATLVAEGKTLKCHRMILSSCSTYFEEVLSGISPFQHPVVFMKDIPFWILKSLCDFMYAGEVHIYQNKLEELLSVAEILKIKGLAGKTDTNEDVRPTIEPKKEEERPKEIVKEEKKKEEKKKHVPTPVPLKEEPSPRVTTPKPSTSKAHHNSRKPEKSKEKDKTPAKKDQNLVDPLDLLEPMYEEEVVKETPKSSIPVKVQEKKSIPVKKPVSKKVKKRRFNEEREESPPPFIQQRKGTRSRPNVKIPKYFHTHYDPPPKESSQESQDATIVREPHTTSLSHSDTFIQVEEIKAEPIDVEDDVIEIEDNVMSYSDQDLTSQDGEEEIIGNYDSPIVNIKKEMAKEMTTPFKKINLVAQPVILAIHTVSDTTKSEEACPSSSKIEQQSVSDILISNVQSVEEGAIIDVDKDENSSEESRQLAFKIESVISENIEESTEIVKKEETADIKEDIDKAESTEVNTADTSMPSELDPTSDHTGADIPLKNLPKDSQDSNLNKTDQVNEKEDITEHSHKIKDRSDSALKGFIHLDSDDLQSESNASQIVEESSRFSLDEAVDSKDLSTVEQTIVESVNNEIEEELPHTEFEERCEKKDSTSSKDVESSVQEKIPDTELEINTNIDNINSEGRIEELEESVADNVTKDDSEVIADEPSSNSPLPKEASEITEELNSNNISNEKKEDEFDFDEDDEKESFPQNPTDSPEKTLEMIVNDLNESLKAGDEEENVRREDQHNAKEQIDELWNEVQTHSKKIELNTRANEDSMGNSKDDTWSQVFKEAQEEFDQSLEAKGTDQKNQENADSKCETEETITKEESLEHIENTQTLEEQSLTQEENDELINSDINQEVQGDNLDTEELPNLAANAESEPTDQELIGTQELLVDSTPKSEDIVEIQEQACSQDNQEETSDLLSQVMHATGKVLLDSDIQAERSNLVSQEIDGADRELVGSEQQREKSNLGSQEIDATEKEFLDSDNLRETTDLVSQEIDSADLELIDSDNQEETSDLLSQESEAPDQKLIDSDNQEQTSGLVAQVIESLDKELDSDGHIEASDLVPQETDAADQELVHSESQERLCDIDGNKEIASTESEELNVSLKRSRTEPLDDIPDDEDLGGREVKKPKSDEWSNPAMDEDIEELSRNLEAGVSGTSSSQEAETGKTEQSELDEAFDAMYKTF